MITGNRINLTPTEYATYLPSGDKTFSRFQKPEKPYWILKCSKDFLPTINGKSINLTPSEILRISLQGIKHFEAKKV